MYVVMHNMPVFSCMHKIGIIYVQCIYFVLSVLCDVLLFEELFMHILVITKVSCLSGCPQLEHKH